MWTWRRRKETSGVLGKYSKRYKSVYISVNNKTNFIFLQILLCTPYGMDKANKSSPATVPLISDQKNIS
jgi:hypothetical protein